ncbi:MAG TPA: F0F1 ATP synthase subunit delta [Burkholderiales bacterium]|nr:F0F1 ATP synthase subunit delta [Burkholderiales bacterium]
MAEAATVARPYAEAVFGLAEKAGALAQWQEMLAAMAQIAAHPDMRACISNPNLGARPLYDLFMALCKEDFPVDARNFVRVLIENDRLELLPEIHGQFIELKNEREGVVEAEIRTAFQLDNAQITGLVADISRRLKRRVQPHVTLDKELIGGVRITAGDEVIDCSVRGQLEDMAAALKR